MINSIDTICFGDSIALGVAQAAGLPCNAVVGRMPDAVLSAIMCTHSAFIRGRAVALSSGLSNNPDGRSYVEQQIVALLAADAARIVIIGVGPGVRAGTNEWLASLAAPAGKRVIFAGPLEPPTVTIWLTGDLPGIHPVDYSEVVDQINAALGTT